MRKTTNASTLPRCGRSKSMKVLVYSPTSSGGQPAYVKEVLSAIGRLGQGIDITLLTRSDLSAQFDSSEYRIARQLDPLKEKQYYKNKLSWAVSRLLRYFLTELRLVNLAIKEKFDAIHYQEQLFFFSTFSILFLRVIARKKVFLTLHNVKPHSYPRFLPKKLIDFLTATRVFLSTRTYVHTAELRALCSNLSFPLKKEKIIVAPHGTWSYFGKMKREIPEIDLFLFGSIRQNKGIDLLLDALSILSDRGVKVTTVLAGKVEHKHFWDSQIVPRIAKLKERQINLKVIKEFLSHEEIKTLAAKSRFLALPYTNFSAQSGVLFDAIALRIPVITTPGHSIAEFVAAYSMGYVSSSNSAEDLALAIERALSSDSSKFRANLDRAAVQHSWASHAAAVTEGYRAN